MLATAVNTLLRKTNTVEFGKSKTCKTYRVHCLNVVSPLSLSTLLTPIALEGTKLNLSEFIKTFIRE